VDFYRFVAPVSGAYRFSTSTPTGPLNAVLGVYNDLKFTPRVAYARYNFGVNSNTYDDGL
jgi:hypothetical protein